jgi:hypothetical protein
VYASPQVEQPPAFVNNAAAICTELHDKLYRVAAAARIVPVSSQHSAHHMTTKPARLTHVLVLLLLLLLLPLLLLLAAPQAR